MRDLVESSVKECPQSLFIIEEVDKIEEGIFNMLKPYFDFHKQIGGTDYRKAMFLILRYCGKLLFEISAILSFDFFMYNLTVNSMKIFFGRMPCT